MIISTWSRDDRAGEAAPLGSNGEGDAGAEPAHLDGRPAHVVGDGRRRLRRLAGRPVPPQPQAGWGDHAGHVRRAGERARGRGSEQQ